MVAREVEQLAAELDARRCEGRQQLGLAVAAFGLAIGAGRLFPALAVPLLFGGISALALAARAFSRRWELLDRLVLDRDAYAIGEVRERAEQAATMKSRHALASSIRGLLNRPELVPSGRIRGAAVDLETLAAELDDHELTLDPAAAVTCARLLESVAESPLHNPAFPPEDLRARIIQILAGFGPRRT